jgi:hypothetical protein
MPGAPEWLAPLAALTMTEGGNRAGARRVLSELLNANEGYIQQAARRSLMQLDALDGIEVLRGRVAAFQQKTGHEPSGWADLVQSGQLPGVPLDPTGVPFDYDATSHAVVISPQSTLSPLPPVMSAR